ncbi:MAG: TonB-dependent receptor [Prolixibacteraceae bacterium]|nr:TonB-dependent receptor [Prolixibacteraceae bacterium]
MKLTIFLILMGLMSVSASIYSQSTKLTMNLHEVSFLEVFRQIEAQSEFVFIYKNEIIDIDKKVNVKVEGKTVDVILDEVLRDLNLKYEIIKKQIIITPDHSLPEIKPRDVAPTMEQPQKKSVKGKVTDSNGDAVPGAAVMVKGTTIGIITDFDGNFTLDVPLDAKILSISFVGMKPQEIPIGSKTNFSVVLEEETVGVDEVVVVGYGVQKKESVVGSIAQTTNEELKRSGNVTDLKQALTGQLPGITTVTSSGEPGGTGTGNSATSMFIRGRNTWNGGQPLILVDGVERNMDNLDVSEVESISVLKDASATAVFGVKGANGVVLITTKRGAVGKTQISFSYNTTALAVSKLPQKLDSYNTLLIKNEIIERETVLNETSWADYTPGQIVERYRLPQSPEYAMIYPNVNWVDAMFKDYSLSHRAALNVQGGTNFVSYFGSASYLHEGDMFEEYENNKGYEPNYNFDRFNFRNNLDFKITNSTNIKVNLSGFYSQKNTSQAFNNQSSQTSPLAWSAAYGMPPDAFLPQYEDGRWGASYRIPAEALPNPVAVVYNTGMLQYRTTELNADFALEQKLDVITKGLSAKASIFYDNGFRTTGGLYDVTNAVRPESAANTPQKIVYPERYTGPGQDPSEYIEDIPSSSSNQFDWIVRPWWLQEEATGDYESASNVRRRTMYQFQLNYARNFGEHNVGALALVKREEYASGNMFKNYREDWVSRFTYDYASKYLLEFNGAYNGSEKFGPGYRFDFFPSLAAGWYVSNEKFFKIDWMNRLKLRYSIGIVGDDQGGGRWLYESQYSYAGSARMNQNPNEFSPYNYYRESVVGNPDVHWEKALKSNYGIEVGMFDNAISVNYDYFTEDRTDILLDGNSRSSIPPYFGVTAPSANLGAVKASGHELELKIQKRTRFGLNYWANFSITHTINEIIKRDSPQLMASYMKSEGYSIGQSRSLVRAGFYNNWDEIFASVPTETNDLTKLPGYYNLLDYNADGVIKSSEDVIPIGYSDVPLNTYNSTMGVDYKGFSLMVQFYGVNNVSRLVPLQNFVQFQNVLFDHVLDYWSKDNPNANSFIPRWKTQGQNIGDYFLFDGSYIRFKTAELAYTFQNNLVKKAGLSSVRVFINGNNLAFWSKLPDDRESHFSGGSSNQGTYPTPKRFNLGIDVSF